MGQVVGATAGGIRSDQLDSTGTRVLIAHEFSFGTSSWLRTVRRG